MSGKSCLTSRSIFFINSVNQRRHGDAHYVAPSALFHGRACWKRQAIMQTKLPIRIFVSLTIAFFIAQGMFNVISHHYVWVHFYFGLATPLLAGYFPCKLFRWHSLSGLPVNNEWAFCWHWSLWAGIAITFIASFVNEVIDDPKQNGVPFFDAWHHFAADIAGMIVFVGIYFLLLRPMFQQPNSNVRTISTNIG